MFENPVFWCWTGFIVWNLYNRPDSWYLWYFWKSLNLHSFQFSWQTESRTKKSLQIFFLPLCLFFMSSETRLDVPLICFIAKIYEAVNVCSVFIYFYVAGNFFVSQQLWFCLCSSSPLLVELMMRVNAIPDLLFLWKPFTVHSSCESNSIFPCW